MKTENKNKNAFTINLNDDYKSLINILASYYERKAADLLRVLLQPVLINEYAKIQAATHKENIQQLNKAIFKK